MRRLRSAAEMRDLAFEGVFPNSRWASRSSFFPFLQFLVQGLLAFQQLVEFFLWIHSFR